MLYIAYVTSNADSNGVAIRIDKENNRNNKEYFIIAKAIYFAIELISECFVANNINDKKYKHHESKRKNNYTRMIVIKSRGNIAV